MNNKDIETTIPVTIYLDVWKDGSGYIGNAWVKKPGQIIPNKEEFCYRYRIDFEIPDPCSPDAMARNVRVATEE